MDSSCWVNILVLYFICFLYSDCKFKEDSNSFLFTLVNPSGREPIKMLAPKPRGAGGGIHCDRSLGPSFGIEDYYNLRIPKNDSSNNLKCGKVFDKTEGFQTPAKVNFSSYFAGLSNTEFVISELEVFKVNF